jgi:hypothetical protein
MKKNAAPARAGIMGRGSIFRPKVSDKDHRYQGWVTDIGRQRFEHARDHLADLAAKYLGGFAPASISDADVIEYLARGDADARRYLKAMRKELDAAQ